MPQFGPFSAWVEIDGVPVPEFNVSIQPTAPRKVVCFIPCQIGKTFSVAWKNVSFKHQTVGQILVDGIESGGRVIDGPSTVAARHEGLTDCTTLRRFTFASMRLGSSMSLPEELGQITLRIHPCQSGNEISASYEDMRGLGLLDATTDNPLTLHSRPHTQLGQLEHLRTPQSAVAHRLVGPRIVEFCFMYHPLAVLQAVAIAPTDARERVYPRLLSEASPSLFRNNSPLPPSSPPSSSPPVATKSDSCTEYSEEPSRCSDEDIENIDPNPKANPIPRSQPTTILRNSRDNATLGPSVSNMLSFDDSPLCLGFFEDKHSISVPALDGNADRPVLWSRCGLSSHLTLRPFRADNTSSFSRSPLAVVAKPVRPISPGTLMALTEPVLMEWVEDLPDLASLAVDRWPQPETSF